MKNRTDWFKEAGYGIFVHWTTNSLDKDGNKKEYFKAVEDFDIDTFVTQIKSSGAKFLFITTSHSQMCLPFPLKELDDIVPNHTAKRDLIMEIANRLEKENIRLMLYFNGDGSEDPEWQSATGFKTDHQRHAQYCYDVTRAISLKYGTKIHGWWIDCCYEPDVCKGTGVRYDYEKYASALRAGNPDSIIAFNFRGTCGWGSTWGRGIADFQAGEENSLDFLPKGRFSGEGNTQWFALCWMDEFWVHEKHGVPSPVHENERVLEYVRKVKENDGVFAYNVALYQEGHISDKTCEQLLWLKQHGIAD